MQLVTLVIDESGAKGYSDNKESYAGEFGVMAGYLLPNSQLESVQSDLKKIRENFFSDGKVHIADMEETEQHDLREKIFDCFKKHQVNWIYEAVYVEGFYENATLINAMLIKAREGRKSTVKVSCHEYKDLLLAELFQGIFAKSISFTVDSIGNKFHLKIISDRIDKNIQKKFKEKAEEILHYDRKKEKTHKGFDTNTGNIVEGSVTSNIKGNKNTLINLSGIAYSLSCEDSELTLAADVLSNSVHYYLKSYKNAIDLNAKQAILSHPLHKYVYGVIENESCCYNFSDSIYKHPR